MSEQNKAFFMVWNPEGRAPTVKHWDYQSACREAERLAKANNSHRFVVMCSMDAFAVNEVIKTDLRPGPDSWDDGIPF
jgi:hypothetical protein